MAKNSLILDSNIAIAIEKDVAGETLLLGEQAALRKFKTFAGSDFRITNQVASEINSAEKYGRLVFDSSHPDFASTLIELENAKVGGASGVADRLIVREAFFAEGDSPARLLTNDKGVYNKLSQYVGTSAKITCRKCSQTDFQLPSKVALSS